jgi:hypothetical protein
MASIAFIKHHHVRGPPPTGARRMPTLQFTTRMLMPGVTFCGSLVCCPPVFSYESMVEAPWIPFFFPWSGPCYTGAACDRQNTMRQATHAWMREVKIFCCSRRWRAIHNSSHRVCCGFPHEHRVVPWICAGDVAPPRSCVVANGIALFTRHISWSWQLSDVLTCAIKTVPGNSPIHRLRHGAEQGLAAAVRRQDRTEDTQQPSASARCECGCSLDACCRGRLSLNLPRRTGRAQATG